MSETKMDVELGSAEFGGGLKARKALDEDKAFIIDSWASSFRFSPIIRNIMDPDVYKVEIRAQIEDLMNSCPTIVLGQPRQMYDVTAWACFDQKQYAGMPVMHYFLVKGQKQQQGIGRELFTFVKKLCGNAPRMWASHYTHALQFFSIGELEYNPFILRGLGEKL